MNTALAHAPAPTGAPSLEAAWARMDWGQAYRQVTNLRQRIFRATQRQEWQQVRDLQKLLLRSYANHVLSVRQVTQVNAGRRTPGVDGQVVETAAQRMRLVQRLQAAAPHRARPVRRVYIPKASGGRSGSRLSRSEPANTWSRPRWSRAGKRSSSRAVTASDPVGALTMPSSTCSGCCGAACAIAGCSPPTSAAHLT